MTRLSESLRDWPSDTFVKTLKRELTGLKPGILPLAGGLSRGGLVDAGDISVTVLNVTDNPQTIEAKVGVFFTEIVGGCSCGDDPSTENAYCELRVGIDKATAEAEFHPI